MMDKNKFEAYYEYVVKRIYAHDKREADYLLSWGGKSKLQKTLFENEKFRMISFAMNAGIGMAVFVSDEVLVITDKRLLFLEKKLLGTLVTEVSLKQAFQMLEWQSNDTLVIKTEKPVKICIPDKTLNIIKEILYDYM